MIYSLLLYRNYYVSLYEKIICISTDGDCCNFGGIATTGPIDWCLEKIGYVPERALFETTSKLDDQFHFTENEIFLHFIWRRTGHIFAAKKLFHSKAMYKSNYFIVQYVWGNCNRQYFIVSL